jgi:Amidohydrolase family
MTTATGSADLMDAFRRVLAWLVLALCQVAAAADYIVLVQDQPAGHLRETVSADGRRVITEFSFRDNGHGPDLRETLALDERGHPVGYVGEGRTEFGAVVDERYEWRDGRATWSGSTGTTSAGADADAVFISAEGTQAYLGRLAGLALARGGSLRTVDGARIVAEVVQRWQPGGAAPPLVLVALTGLFEVPVYHWLRDEPGHGWFASGWPGFYIVERGFEPHAGELLRRALEVWDRHFSDIQRRLAQPLDGLTLVRAVRWFDAPAARMRGPSDVWLAGGRITAVTTPGAWPHAKPDRVVEGRGRTLLPGLWDLHAHTWAGSCLLQLAAGVTGVRDPGNQNDALQRLMAQHRRGEVACPHIVPLGFIEGRSPFSSRNGFVVDTLDEGLAAIEWYAARGYHGVKLYNSVRPEWVPALAARAHALGLRVAGHVPAFMRAEQVVRAGYDELMHANQLMLNFLVRPGDDTRTLMRFERVGLDGGTLDLKSPQARAFIDLLRRRGTVVDPTLAVFEVLFTQVQGEPNPVLASVADHLPVNWRRALRNAQMDLRGARRASFGAAFARMQALVVALHRAGVPVAVGTDMGEAGFALQREAELYVAGGIPAPEVLRMLTANGARLAGEGAERGRIAPGLIADLVLIDGDPSLRIGDLRRAALVIQGGVAYAPEALYEAMGFKPFVPAASLEPAGTAPR